MSWKTQCKIGEFMLFEGYRVLDAELYGEIYNDRLLKAFCTAKIKEQWGLNLSKFNGVALPGGVTLNGGEILSSAKQEIETLEQQVQNKFELPPQFFVG